MSRFIDEGEWLFLKWGLALAVLLTAAATPLLWFFASFSAYGAERQERSVPYDRAKEFSTSMLYYPEQPMVEWPLKPYLDFIEGGNAAATPDQWADALFKTKRINEPIWGRAKAYLQTLVWKKNETKAWYRMGRVLRPYGKWQAGRLDYGYERSFEAGEWGLHDPTTGELIVAGDCGNVVIEKLAAPIAAAPVAPPRPQPTPAAVAPAQPARTPPPRVAAPPVPTAEPTRVFAPPRLQPEKFAVATLGPPTEATKLYQIFVVRDPQNLLMGWGKESMDIKDLNTALQWIRTEKVTMVETGQQVVRFTLYDKAIQNERRRDAVTCNEGRAVATYDVPIEKGYGSIRFRLADLQRGGQGKCLRAELPDSLKHPGGNPHTGTLDWPVPDNVRPDELWFVLP